MSVDCVWRGLYDERVSRRCLQARSGRPRARHTFCPCIMWNVKPYWCLIPTIHQKGIFLAMLRMRRVYGELEFPLIELKLMCIWICVLNCQYSSLRQILILTENCHCKSVFGVYKLKPCLCWAFVCILKQCFVALDTDVLCNSALLAVNCQCCVNWLLFFINRKWEIRQRS